MSTHANTSLAEHTSGEDNSSHLNVPDATRVVITGFGPFLNITENPSFNINQALPSTLTIYRNRKPQTIALERYPEPIRVTYENVLRIIPQIYDQYASESHNPALIPFFIHIGAGFRGLYEIERLAHRDEYTLLDVDQKEPPLQNAEFLVGSRISNQRVMNSPVTARGFPTLDNKETLQTGIDVNGVVQDVTRDVKDLVRYF
ncbi:hypothetical protein FRC20_006910 [Serendipita sp. 405]|nr:hypothetical protein FRC20_006910 [Serendipita sp. 405]